MMVWLRGWRGLALLVAALGLLAGAAGALAAEVDESGMEETAMVAPVGGSIDLTGSWRFRIDPDEIGEASGWQAPEFDDSGWATIDVPGDWESQGITMNNPRWPAHRPECGYNGYAWYRREVVAPADWTGQTVTLKIGAIDDFDWTYVNGQLVGSTASIDSWEQERRYAIPPGVLRSQGPNVIAIRVCDYSANGGIRQGPVALSLGASTPPAAGQHTKVRDSVVQVGGGVTVPADTLVKGDVVAIGGSADISGYVAGSVVAVGGSVRARPGSYIERDAVSVGGGVRRSEGATIEGKEISVGPGISWPLTPSSTFGYHRRDRFGQFWPSILGWAFMAALGALLFRGRLEVMAEALPLHPARAAGLGLLGVAVTPAAWLFMALAGLFVIVILAVTIVGIILIPAAAVALAALILAPAALLLFGMIAVCLSVGRATVRQLNRPNLHAAWAALVGVLLVHIAALIPIVGPLTWVTVAILGFGLVVMTGAGAETVWRGGFRRRPGAASPAPPVAEPPPAPVPPEPAEAEPESQPDTEAPMAADEGEPEPEVRPEGCEDRGREQPEEGDRTQ